MKPARSVPWSWAWALWGVLLASNTQAAPSDPDPKILRAQAYVDLATGFFREGDFASALVNLRNAEPLLENDPAQPAARFNIARCLEEMARPDEAISAYQLYLSSGEVGPRAERAKATLERLRRIGRLAIRCEPAGVHLEIEGVGGRECPTALLLAPGHYGIAASTPGHHATRRDVVVASGDRREEVFSLPAIVAGAGQASPPPPTVRPHPRPAPEAVQPRVFVEPKTTSPSAPAWEFRLSLGTGALITGDATDRLGATLEPAFGYRPGRLGAELATSILLESPHTVLLRPAGRLVGDWASLRAGPQVLLGAGPAIAGGFLAGGLRLGPRTGLAFDLELALGLWGDASGVVPAATVEVRAGVAYAF